MEKKLSRKIKNTAAAGIIVLLILGLIGIIIWYQILMRGAPGSDDEKDLQVYDYHCVYITENNEDPFWNSIYEGADKEGKATSIFVENYGEALSLTYTIEEKMEMAIASGVDAIIVEGSKTADMTRLIDAAAQKGIVVVTVYTDNVSSKRQSFIGVNNFQMGYRICAEAYQYLDKGLGGIMIVFDEGSNNDQDHTLLNTGMKKYLDEMNSKAVLNAQLISSNETYDTQEKIRSLLRNKATRPKVLVCTNLLQTQCAYQSVVDLNCVGEVKIIGFYSSELITEAIDKDIIQAVLMVDTEQMGRAAVQSIREYMEYGYSSDYVSVDIEVVNKENIQRIKEVVPEND